MRSSTTRPSTASGAITLPTSPARSRTPAFDTQRDTFLGAYRGWDRPLAVERGQCANSIAYGWAPVRRAPGGADPAARRDARGDLPARLPRKPARCRSSTRPVRSASTSAPSGRSSRNTCSPPTRLRLSTSFAPILGWLVGRLPGADPRRAYQPHGQHLERLPVHGHLQHVALGLLLRIGHRARDGLPRFEPGPARFRPHGARARPPAHPGYRRHPAAQRRAPTTSTSR